MLNNWRHHREDQVNGWPCAAALDEFSSAISFVGWREMTRFAIPDDYTPLPVARPQTWLLATGWTKHPAISWREVPKGL